MTIRALAIAALALGAVLPPGGPGASALTLSADYAVSIRGIPVGRATLRAEIAGARYSIAFSGRISGLARLFSDARTQAQASGLLGDDRPRAETYVHVWTEDDDTEAVSMRFEGDGVTEITVEPPIRRPERYVPMTAEDKADAVDMVSAFLWPAASGATPEACTRTLPLIDGRRRFDIQSGFDRMESFATRASQQSRVVVCSLRYLPIAGHRIDKKADGFLADSREMEVWLAAAGDGLVAPVRVQFESRFGRVVVQARAFKAE